jgi:hypothetical protein
MVGELDAKTAAGIVTNHQQHGPSLVLTVARLLAARERLDRTSARAVTQALGGTVSVDELIAAVHGDEVDSLDEIGA